MPSLPNLPGAPVTQVKLPRFFRCVSKCRIDSPRYAVAVSTLSTEMASEMSARDSLFREEKHPPHVERGHFERECMLWRAITDSRAKVLVKYGLEAVAEWRQVSEQARYCEYSGLVVPLQAGLLLRHDKKPSKRPGPVSMGESGMFKVNPSTEEIQTAGEY